MLVRWALILKECLPFKLGKHTRTQPHTHTWNFSLHTCTLAVIIQRRHVQVAQERRQRRESKARLKWEGMTAGAAVWCQGLTAVWTEATLTNWANLAAGEEKESRRTKWLLFSSSLSRLIWTFSYPHQLSFYRSLARSLALHFTFSLSHFNNCPLHLPITG